MCSSDARAAQVVSETAADFAAASDAAVDAGQLDAVDDDSLGRVIGAALRLYAAKVQAGHTPRPLAGNSGLTITDVCIGTTALMQEVGLETFELGAWQSMSGLGRR